MTGMDDLADLSYFYILITDRLTDGWTDGRTLVLVKLLLRLKMKKCKCNMTYLMIYIVIAAWRLTS